MFAIVECGGKQYKAEKDTVLSVEKLDAEVGAKIQLKTLMSFDNGQMTVGEGAAKVTAEVVRQGKESKVIVYKYKAKKNERKKQGHRQPYTKIKIVAIEG